jgi:hypothetical protein
MFNIELIYHFLKTLINIDVFKDFFLNYLIIVNILDVDWWLILTSLTLT